MVHDGFGGSDYGSMVLHSGYSDGYPDPRECLQFGCDESNISSQEE